MVVMPHVVSVWEDDSEEYFACRIMFSIIFR